ncbi:MAG: tRNA lysidine(34) synthetase TilS [Hyphomicrobiales bacterium]|nr:tRNA lysidine(34) synthetase TilS [Hyphomicrobiales bacterium]
MLTAPDGIDLSGLFSSFDIQSRGSVIAAVSGGSDSTALLALLNDNLGRLSAGTRLVAVTVDHGLRAESRDEAAAVARFCASQGIAHRTVVWTGEKPATGIAAAAREARHALLAEVARIERAGLVLTGHTADDLAETVLMRTARGKGRGLAGIAPATLFDGTVWFGRPLLDVRRQALRAFLERRGIGWIEDPSNFSDRYERPRVRKAISEAGITQALRIASEAATERTARGEDAARLIASHAERKAPGLLRLGRDFLRDDSRPTAAYALRILLAVAGGTEHLPDLDRTAELFARLASGDPVRAVLSRALVDRRKDGIFLLRERRGLPACESQDEGTIWDGRYRFVRRHAGIAPGADAPVDRVRELDAPASLVRQAAAGLPQAALQGDAVPVLAPWARYLPSFDDTPARAVARLIGAPEMPEPPFHRHIERKA